MQLAQIAELTTCDIKQILRSVLVAHPRGLLFSEIREQLDCTPLRRVPVLRILWSMVKAGIVVVSPWTPEQFAAPQSVAYSGLHVYRLSVDSWIETAGEQPLSGSA